MYFCLHYPFILKRKEHKMPCISVQKGEGNEVREKASYYVLYYADVLFIYKMLKNLLCTYQRMTNYI